MSNATVNFNSGSDCKSVLLQSPIVQIENTEKSLCFTEATIL